MNKRKTKARDEAEFNFPSGASSGQVLDSDGWRDKTEVEKQVDERFPFLQYSDHYCEFLSGVNFGYDLAKKQNCLKEKRK